MSQKRIATQKPGVFYREIEGDKPSKPVRVYYIRYRRGGRAGSLIEEPVGKSTEGMTPTIAANIRAERMQGKALSNQEDRRQKEIERLRSQNRWTIARLWDEYKINNPNLKGIVTDENRFKNYLHVFAKLTPEEITTQMIDSLRVRLLQAGKTPQTAKNVLELLRRIINFSVKKGHCPWQDPSRLYFEMPKVNNVKTEMLTDSQRKSLLAALTDAANKKAAGLMLLALCTGMRRSEMFRLQWKDIDWERGFINIVGEAQEGPKSGKDQKIPMNEQARQILLAQERGESPYVFPGRDGKSQLQDIAKQVRNIKKSAGLPNNFRPLHGLRHVFASLGVSNGVPLSVMQRLLTHASPQMTNRYAHLADEALKNAAANVGALITQVDNGSID